MKKLLYIIPLALAVVQTGCSDFTDINPKGMNVLDKVEDLNQVLNYEYVQYAFEFTNAMTLVNDMMPDGVKIPDLLRSKEMSLAKALYTWDETADRALLTVDDRHYEGFYKIINTVANPVIAKADKASGNRALAAQYKAEAYVLRAYMYYIIVNFYAKAYDPATAETDPGVPYIDENDNVQIPAEKQTVQKIYDHILADLNAAFALNALVKTPPNKMRIGEAFALGVKACVLMSVRDYEGALEVANNALAICNVIDDYNSITGEFERPEMSSKEDIFYASFWELFAQAQTPEMAASYELGNIFYEIYPRGTNYGTRFYSLPDLQCFASTNICFNNMGLTTVDLYLIKGEALIRTGKVADGLSALDIIRQNRVRMDVFEPLLAANAVEAMKYVRNISRTENFFSYKNYVNLKRWNTEGAYRETIRKSITIQVTDPVSGVVTTETYTFSLRPDSPLWIFPFPQSATLYNPHLTQNY